MDIELKFVISTWRGKSLIIRWIIKTSMLIFVVLNDNAKQMFVT